MTPAEMDAEIIKVIGEGFVVNTKSIAFRRWRKLFIAGMGASMAHVHHNSDRDALAADIQQLERSMQ